MRTYQLQGTIAGTTDAVNYVEMRANGTICAIDMSLDSAGGALAAGDLCRCQVALNNTTQQTGNDATNVLANIGLGISVLTSGAASNMAQKVVAPIAVPVKAGDRIYLHATESGSLNWTFRAIIHVK